MRIGINTGEVLAGDAAAGQPFATGVAVNLAMRLQQAALPDEILLGEATQRLLGDAAEVGARRANRPRWLSGACPRVPPAWLSASVRRPGRSSGASFVGRANELASARERVRGRSSRATEPGRARPRRRRDRQEPPRFGVRLLAGRGRCEARSDDASRTGKARPTFRSPRSSAQIAPERPQATIARLLEGDEHAVARRRAHSAVGRRERGRGADRRALLGGPAAASRPSPAAGRWSSSSRTCTGRSRRFSTSSSISTAWTVDAPLLIVCLARPELRDARPGLGTDADIIALEPLVESAAKALVGELGGSDVDPEAKKRIVAIAEGNPLYARATARVRRRGRPGGSRDRPADGRGTAREPPRPARARGTRATRTRGGRRSGVHAGGRRASHAARRPRRSRRPDQRPRSSRAHLDIERRQRRRGSDPLPPRPDPRRDLRRDHEGDAGRPARTVRGLARGPRRAGGGARRLSPRAGASVPRGAAPQ